MKTKTNILILSAFMLLTFSCEKEETKANGQIVDSADSIIYLVLNPPLRKV